MITTYVHTAGVTTVCRIRMSIFSPLARACATTTLRACGTDENLNYSGAPLSVPRLRASAAYDIFGFGRYTIARVPDARRPRLQSRVVSSISLLSPAALSFSLHALFSFFVENISLSSSTESAES